MYQIRIVNKDELIIVFGLLPCVLNCYEKNREFISLINTCRAKRLIILNRIPILFEGMVNIQFIPFSLFNFCMEYSGNLQSADAIAKNVKSLNSDKTNYYFEMVAINTQILEK